MSESVESGKIGFKLGSVTKDRDEEGRQSSPGNLLGQKIQILGLCCGLLDEGCRLQGKSKLLNGKVWVKITQVVVLRAQRDGGWSLISSCCRWSNWQCGI